MKTKILFVAAIAVCGILLSSETAFAVQGLKVVDIKTFTTKAEIAIIPEDFTGIMRMTAVPMAERKSNIAVTFAGQKDPVIKIYDFKGTELLSWKPISSDFQGELPVSAGDVDGDGVSEIIVTDGPGGTGDIRIFDLTGKMKTSFQANGPDYHLGVETAIGDVTGDGKKEIIVSIIEKDNKEAIKFFDITGKEVAKKISVDLKNTFEPLKVGALDLGTDGVVELLVGNGFGNEPTLKLLQADGTLINTFKTYADNFLGGVFFSIVDSPEMKAIITGAGFSGGPHLKVLDFYGTLRDNGDFFSYGASFAGGINVVTADFDADGIMEIATLPYQPDPQNGRDIYKFIEVDISEQRLYYYENGKQIGKHIVSSGRWDMPTPLGEYRIFQKAPRAFSARYGLYMPYWMSFKPMYGFHELPEWPSGYKEGANHLGVRVSHGCVRLGVGPAKILYNWAPIGTKVFIHN